MKHRPMTLVVPYYDNPQMFAEQQRTWLAFSAEVRQALHVIVVDDGSPRHRADGQVLSETRGALASFRVFRTGVDVRWNWLFCRNLGVEQATTEWVLMTDMDHVVPETTWHRVMVGPLDQHHAYRLSRVQAPDMAPRNPHPNTWILTRHMFLNRIGGYDERFSGVYGTDGEFHGRVELWAQRIVVLPEVTVVYPDSVVPDACTTTYGRKEPIDRERRAQIRHDIRSLGDNYVPKRLTFPWQQVV